MPRVSIIVNIWNGSRFLRETLDTALAQTFSDWELIAWDDHSTDDSAAVVRSCSDTRIRYFLSPDRTPLGRARYLALQEARGDWVAFLDQDDLWTPDKIEKQLVLGESAPEVGFVYGRTVSFTPDGRHRDFDHRHEFDRLPEGRILDRLFVESCFVAMSSVLFRRSALHELGEFPPNVEVSPDYFMYLGVSQRYEARAVQEVVCHYRLHGNNMTTSNFKQVHSECLWFIDRWGGPVSAQILTHRRRVHHTLIALEEMKQGGTRRTGLQRLIANGSLRYLFSRPLARSFRAVRRRFQTPYWQRDTIFG